MIRFAAANHLWAPTLCLAVLLCLGGCQSRSRAETAILLQVEWEKVEEILSVELHPRAGAVEVFAVLESGQEVQARLPIGQEQSRKLRDGARLLVRTQDGKYLETPVTIVPR